MNWKVRFNMPQAEGKRVRPAASRAASQPFPGLFKPLALLLIGLLTALLLAACGTAVSDLQLPTNTSGPEATPISSATSPANNISPTTAAVPTATAALVPVVPSTATPAPTSTPQATATPVPPAATATTAPAVSTGPPATVAPRPITNGTPAKIDPAAELKVIKAAYDAINEHYYTQPDTANLAQKGLNEAAAALEVTAPAAPAWNSDPARDWLLFQETFQKMVATSQVELAPGDVAHRVANAFALAVGDLHTYFLDQARTDTINRMGKGDNSTVGFGLYFVLYQNGYFVTRMVTGSPAQLAGVQVGDRLVQFDGTAVNVSNFSKLSSATEGRTYDFVFKPLDGGADVTRHIAYKRYTIPTVEWKMVQNHIGFITINAFHLDVQTRLDTAIAAAKSQGTDSLIIDLRYNGGGYNFDRVSGRFISNGTVMGSFTNRGGTSTIKARSEGKQVIPALPLVVLIDKGSASASEVFSLAVKDFGAGTLVGSKSIGAIGTVAYWPLGDGTSLGVTNSVYETVKGEKLNGVGITPDIVVARSTEDILNGRDPQLDAALKHLDAKAKGAN
jgi:carboxyl-terminal processing protease